MNASVQARSYRASTGFGLPDAVLFIFFLLSLRALQPNLTAIEFDRLTVQDVVPTMAAGDFGNQLVWLLLAAVSASIVVASPSRFIALLKQVLPLAAVIAFCVATIAWSTHPEITLRRVGGLVLSSFSLLVGVAYVSRVDRIAASLMIASGILLCVNLAFLTLPVAFDEFGALRGTTGHKNTLGGIAAFLIIAMLAFIPAVRPRAAQGACAAMIAIWVFLLALTVSKTSIALIVLTPAVFVLLRVMSAEARLTMLQLVACLLASAACAGLLAYAASGLTPSDIIGMVWRDVTFTGRIELWNFMLGQIAERPWLGTGFAAFWGVGFEAPNLSSIYNWIRITNEAHSGWLDVGATLGLIGAALFFFAVVSGISRAEVFRFRYPIVFRTVWMIFIFILLHNMQESSFLQPFNALWHVALLALFVTARLAAEPDWEGAC